MTDPENGPPPPDILSFGPSSARRIELPTAPPTAPPTATPPSQPAATPPIPAGATPPDYDPPRQATTGLRVGRTQLIVALVVVLAVAGGLTWWLTRDNPVDLAVDDLPIGNAQQVLDSADPVFRAIAAADEAALPDDAGCWFAPSVKDSTTEAPRVACGPVALGIAGNGQRWLLGTVSYSAGQEQTTGRFTDFTGVADLDPGLLNRPDGASPPDGQDLTASTGGIRSVDGRRITNADTAVDDADDAFAELTADASVSPDSRCYLAAGVSGGRTIADGTLLCGPILLRSSEPTKQWASWTYSTQNGDLLVDATISSPSLTGLTSTVALPAGVTLWRPDGATPPVDAQLALPDAEPQESGYATVLDDVLTSADIPLTVPDDGRLYTPALRLDLTGVATATTIGAGKDAIVAADGEKLVVATFTATRPDDAPATGSTPSLLIDGRRVALPSIRFDGDGTLIMSVPSASRTVALDLLTEGRSASISLLTGARPADSSPVPYRDQPTAGQSITVAVTVTMPAGDPLTATGAVTESTLSEWTTSTGYAPPGSAVLSLTVSQWQLTRPCCDVADVSATARWQLLLPDGTVVQAQPTADSSSAPAPVFLVPETVGAAQLVVDVDATFTAPDVSGSDVPGSATGTSGPLDLVVPE